MENLAVTDFIVIDDNEINNNICKMVIEKTFPEAAVNTFTEPETGLNYINIAYSAGTDIKKIILLLDINMPSLNGWEVLEQFEHFPDRLRAMFKIFMLSSSVTLQDKVHAENHPLIAGYIEKPLTIQKLKNMLP